MALKPGEAAARAIAASRFALQSDGEGETSDSAGNAGRIMSTPIPGHESRPRPDSGETCKKVSSKTVGIAMAYTATRG